MDHFPGWMLECAYSYLEAAELLDAQHLPQVAQVNAAIGMEILLKSFISLPDQNQGTSGETYKLEMAALAKANQQLLIIGKSKRNSPDKHDLLTLFYAVPDQNRRSLDLDSQVDCFERYRNGFTNSRYPYESDSAKFSDVVLIRMLRWTLANAVGYHKERGSQDAFVMSYIAKQRAGLGG